MNSAARCLVGFVLLLPVGAAGQNQNPPPVPKPPFLAPIPDNTITTIEVTSENPAGNMPATFKKVDRIIQIKFGPTRELISQWSDGSETQVWYSQGYRLEKSPGESVLITPAPGGTAGDDADFTSLNWLDASNYVDIENHDGGDCYRFKVDLKLPAQHMVVHNLAYINIKTKRPVTWDIGPNHLKLDSIEARKGSDALVMPEEFTRQLKAYRLAAGATNAYKKQ